MVNGQVVAIVQARLGSSRLPGKVFASLAGKPLIWHVINRVSNSKRIAKVVLATTDQTSDDELALWGEGQGLAVYRGQENDVLDRYYQAAKQTKADVVVRITADDPFKDPMILDQVIDKFFSESLDFAFNNSPPSYPEGLDIEVFSFEALERASCEAKSAFEREHVTQYFYRNPSRFRHGNLSYSEDLSWLRWTIDVVQDLEMAQEVYKELFDERSIFLMGDILALLKRRPEIAQMNQNVTRSAMYAHLNK